MKMLKRKKGKDLIKRHVILCGFDNEGDPILVNGRTRGFLDDNVIKAETEMYEEFQLPVQPKKVGQLTQAEKKLYDIRPENEDIKIIMVYDESNPKVREAKEKTADILKAIKLVTHFDMDRKIEYEDGSTIDGWQFFKDTFDIEIKKGSYYQLAKFLISNDGFMDDAWNTIISDIKAMKSGLKTLGDIHYEDMIETELELDEIKEKHKEALGEIKEQIDASEDSDQ